ncbi:MAG: dUTP diphosphatase [Gammaproteobacteria bacterium]|nr:dUTP diphosphatase [Pseudohongiella sp.]MAY56919.1 dUTP diphosphatase [Gammaproteobacteria bacterium]MBJ56396.1 dUTP diphosphatase [Gammaproteobacteria bacterium]|tara:strand:+ start:4591 stop:5253 length:663 start_codon:yes stop_codon:yes gene_type:complete
MHDTLSPRQARTMLELQTAMNSKVDPDWLNAGYPYLRAVLVEASEAIEHHGWKWWKKQTLDLPQLQMEVIDIWHFLMSEVLLRAKGDLETSLTQIIQPTNSDSLLFDGREWQLGGLSLLEKLELLTATAAARRIELPLFEHIMRDCEMSWNELFRQYVGKNVLNFFRQDHGYKQGSYQKLWHGREDNEHLVEVMGGLSAETDDYPARLYQALLERYPASH